MILTLDALNRAALKLGKAVVFRADRWDGESDLSLEFLGHTEGDVVFNGNETIATLTVPEQYGNGQIGGLVYVSGADPVATIPLYLADPTLRDTLSPTGDGRIGIGGRVPVVRHTLVLMPHQLYYNDATKKHDAKIQYVAGGLYGTWTKSAEAAGDPDAYVALTDAETDLLNMSIWMFDGYFTRPPVTFRHGSPTEVAKDIESVEFRATVPEAEAALEIMAMIGPPGLYGIEMDIT